MVVTLQDTLLTHLSGIMMTFSVLFPGKTELNMPKVPPHIVTFRRKAQQIFCMIYIE